MRLRVWIYFIKSAFQNIVNNRLIHMISIGTITISMLLLGAFMLLAVNLNNWIMEWGESLSMSVYLRDGIDQNAIKRVEKRVLELKGAKLKDFISKEQALNNLKTGLGDQAALLDGLKQNPLPASFEIIFINSDDNRVDPKEIKMDLEKMEEVDEVQYSEQWVEQFEGVKYIFRIAGFIMGGLLCLAVLFITTNTIKLTIYSRREEVEIYKLVGASDFFVKTPFILEGIIQGIFSGMLALFMLLLIYTVFSIKSINLFGFPVLEISFLSLDNILFILVLSMSLGFMGGVIAIGRFFKI